MQTSSYEANHVFLTGKCLKEEKFIYSADKNISLLFNHHYNYQVHLLPWRSELTTEFSETLEIIQAISANKSSQLIIYASPNQLSRNQQSIREKANK